ncbi:MAG: AAA family ATPase [Deltaproteobacteria bacterium]|nr:AAA family ATPase [Deltaproteobacteria bacterium]
MENVRCFADAQTLPLSDEKGRPYHWTLILGENGTGKTTLLQALAAISVRDVRVGPAASELKNLYTKSLWRWSELTSPSSADHPKRLRGAITVASGPGESVRYGANAFFELTELERLYAPVIFTFQNDVESPCEPLVRIRPDVARSTLDSVP